MSLIVIKFGKRHTQQTQRTLPKPTCFRLDTDLLRICYGEGKLRGNWCNGFWRSRSSWRRPSRRRSSEIAGLDIGRPDGFRSAARAKKNAQLLFPCSYSKVDKAGIRLVVTGRRYGCRQWTLLLLLYATVSTPSKTMASRRPTSIVLLCCNCCCRRWREWFST